MLYNRGAITNFLLSRFYFLLNIMFIDEAKIEVRAGRGGNGILSFRRERFVAKGGPDGGDGGDGGSVYIKADQRMTTLHDFRRQKKFKAGDGQRGGRNKRHGKNGEDLVLHLPLGTVVKIFEKDKKELEEIKIIDLTSAREKIMIATGGKGGHGNAYFCTATQQEPRKWEKGEKGEKRILELELKLIADVGIIGLPNSGKSTLLARVSNARPKIAEYPFTTLEPNLGVVNGLVMADIPGLIEKAHLGKGLGMRFLRHIERCKILIHIIDGTEKRITSNYRIINCELKSYSPKLARKKQIIVLNKIDALNEEEIKSKLKKLKKASKKSPIPISAVTGKGVKELIDRIKRLIY